MFSSRYKRQSTLLHEILLLKVLHQDNELHICIQMITSRLLKGGHGVSDNCKRPRRDFRVKAGKNGVDAVEIFCVIEEAVAGVINRN